MKITFPISISVGTRCQAECPYCSVRRLPQAIANGSELVDACQEIMQRLSGYFDAFTVRVTGGEIGMVQDLNTFIEWLNSEDSVLIARLYTNGLMFDRDAGDLRRKCRVYEHYVHRTKDDELTHYGVTPRPVTLPELEAIIRARNPQCLTYRMVLVDGPGISHELRVRLNSIGIHMTSLTGASGGLNGHVDVNENRFCFTSRYLYVYDVANHCFFNCCEVKDPSYGYRSGDIVEFLVDTMKEPYKLCSSCRTCSDIRNHRNATAIDGLREKTRKGEACTIL